MSDYAKARERRLADCREAALQQATDAQPDAEVIMPPLPEGYGSLKLAGGEHQRIEREAADLFAKTFVDTVRARIADMRTTADGLEKLMMQFRYARDTA